MFSYFHAKLCILLPAEVEAVQRMNQSIESSRLASEQVDAVAKSVATKMKTIAVTPEILETHFSRHRNKVSGLLSDHRSETERQLERADERLQRIERTIRHLNRDLFQFQMNILLLISGIAFVATTIVAIVTLFAR